MAKQAIDRYMDTEKRKNIKNISLTDFETFQKQIKKEKIIPEEIPEETIYKIIFEFLSLIKDICEYIEEHNKNFLENETNEGFYEDEDDIERRNINRKRFQSVIQSEKKEEDKYYKSLQIHPEDFFQEVTPELISTFTRINNLFIKKDSINALSMFNNTREENGTLNDDDKGTNTTSFDKTDRGLKNRNGYYIIQGASEKMITQAIQKRILTFNTNIEKIIK